jgi:hypothetical protein
MSGGAVGGQGPREIFLSRQEATMKVFEKYEGISLATIVILSLAAVMLFVGILLVRSPLLSRSVRLELFRGR